jgi:hypothetical protein
MKVNCENCSGVIWKPAVNVSFDEKVEEAR